MAKQGQSGATSPASGTVPVSETPPTPPNGTLGSLPASGTTPPVPGAAEGAVGQGSATPEKTTPPAGSEGDTPAAGTPPAPPDPPPAKEGQKRVKCAALKGSKITIGTGEIIRIDENGIFAVEAKEAARLLTIPGYEEA